MLSPLICFGTSTWAYEGWYGLVYTQLYPPGGFKRRCLAEYARYEFGGERLFRTVGLDQSFYGRQRWNNYRSTRNSFRKGVLRAHRTAHVYNHWTYMPPLMAQHERLTQTFTAPFTVVRLLTPREVKYEDAVKVARPYNRIVRELPDMRADTVRLVRQAVKEDRRSYVLVNNRSEGCASLTIQAMVRQLAGSP